MQNWMTNCWYVGAESHEVRNNKPLGRVLLEQPVVFWRKRDGTPVAMDDHCPHRYYPLSRGAIIEDDIRCGYHGMKINSQGHCAWVPGQDRLPNTRNRTYPLVERFGWVWIWMGDAQKADPGLIPSHIFQWMESDEHVSLSEYLPLNCNWMLIMENLLDHNHLHFAHQTSIGSPAIRDGRLSSKTEVRKDGAGNVVEVARWMPDDEPMACLLDLYNPRDQYDNYHVAELAPPNCVVIRTGGAPARTALTGAERGALGSASLSYNMNAITPETARSCHQFWANAIPREFEDYVHDFSRTLFDIIKVTFREDFELLAAQQAAIEQLHPELGGAPPRWPMSLETDKGALKGRALIERMVQDDQAARQLASAGR